MNKVKRLLLICAVLTVLIITGCSRAERDMQQNVIIGKSVFVDQDGTIYFGCNQTICTAIIEDRKVTGFTSLAETTGTVLALAVHDDNIYVMSDGGFSRYHLNEDGRIGETAEVLTKVHFDEAGQFEIIDDSIYFLSDGNLCCIPEEGGLITEIKRGVLDFEATDEAIYYMKTNGKIFTAEFDNSEEKNICKAANGRGFTISGSSLYYNNDGIIEKLSLSNLSSSDTGNAKMANNISVPWVSGENLFYADERHNCRLKSSSGEQELGRVYSYPNKSEGCLYGDCLVMYFADDKIIQMVDFSEGKVYGYSIEEKIYKKK